VGGTTNQTADRSLERLVREIGDLIQRARPEERDELRQMACDLIRTKAQSTEAPRSVQESAVKQPLNLVALGRSVLIIGVGLAVILPPVGLILTGSGLAVILIGAMHRLFT
jgi:hypothetical protein